MVDRDDPSALVPAPDELFSGHGPPETVAGWKALADGLLTDKCCPFHRNVEISSRYAWAYDLLPSCFKWAAMAAIASHHVRLALFPLRLDTDRRGYVDFEQGLARRRLLLTDDANTIRATNNAIFNDIFWAHLAYLTSSDGVGSLRALLRNDRTYALLLAGFEMIDEGRHVLESRSSSPQERQTASDLVWEGNVRLLEHEQQMLVQPQFDRLSPLASRLVSLGSTTSFEVRGVRPGAGYFTSFYVDSLARGFPKSVRSHGWPRITRYDDRWRWLVTSVVPRFRRFDSDLDLVSASLQHIFDEARAYASSPCMQPRTRATRRVR